MHPVRKQRLLIVVGALLLVGIAVGLVSYALSENINAFYAPADVAAGKAPSGSRIRVGGLVVVGSVQRVADSLAVVFTITDGQASLSIDYTGILPDLFREGQGIIATGELTADGRFAASEVLAKHDENYMPPEVQEALEKGGHPAAQ